MTWSAKLSHRRPKAMAHSPQVNNIIRIRNKVMRVGLHALLFTVAAVLVGGTAHAHHSFTATYDATLEIEIEGSVAQFMFRNPHSLLHILAPDENGVERRWAIEWSNIGRLNEEGVSRETLKIGDHVVVRGNPGRNPDDYRMLMRSVVRPLDGWSWAGAFQ